MLNMFWTLLNRQKTCSDGRAVQEGLYAPVARAEPLHSLMVPDTDALYSSRCTEQLLQVVLDHDTYSGTLLDEDTCNTYGRDILSLSDTIYADLSNTSGMTVLVMDEGAELNWGLRTYSFSVDPVGLEVSVNNGRSSSLYSFTHSGDMTNKIPLDTDLYMRLQGALPVAPFTFKLSCRPAFKRSLTGLLAAVEAVGVSWDDPEYRKVFDHSDNAMDRLAAVTMNLYRTLKNG